MKCDCGLSYISGLPEDEKDHQAIHAAYFYGPEIFAVLELSPAATDGALPIYMVDRSCSKKNRDELAHVAMVAHRSMPEYPAGYDGTVTDDDQRLFLVAEGARIVSMAITSLDERFWHLAWNTDGTIAQIDQTPSIHRSYKIARVWTAAGYRRKGLAVRLVQTVSHLLPCQISDLGWELPFTQAGGSLVKRLCPDSWWGCGDQMTLWKTLRVL